MQNRHYKAAKEIVEKYEEGEPVEPMEVAIAQLRVMIAVADVINALVNAMYETRQPKPRRPGGQE